MKVPAFVVTSSLGLALWLGVTFVRTVPMETYPTRTRVNTGLAENAPETTEKKPAEVLVYHR